MESKGLIIKVLSGSIPDSALALAKADFIKLTIAIHNNEEAKLKVITDLWQNANGATKVSEESPADNKRVSKDTSEQKIGGRDKE